MTPLTGYYGKVTQITHYMEGPAKVTFDCGAANTVLLPPRDLKEGQTILIDTHGRIWKR